jgi:hypothetical protein
MFLDPSKLLGMINTMTKQSNTTVEEIEEQKNKKNKKKQKNKKN